MKKQLVKLAGAALLAMPFASMANLNPAPPQSTLLEVAVQKPLVNAWQDITYAQPRVMGRPLNLKMDILQPRSESKLPAVLFVTGGGFLMSPKANYIQQRLAIAEAGYVVASIEYRHIPQGKFPDPLLDVKSAVRYLRAHAEEFGIDKDKIAIMGESAGGYFAALAATTNGDRQFDLGENLDQSSSVQAAIDLYGLSDLTQIGADYSPEVQAMHDGDNASEALMLNGIPPFAAGGAVKANPELAAQANPITHISNNTPPFLLLHGDADVLVSPSQTKILFEALVEKGVSAQRYVVKNADHAGIYWAQPQVMQVVIDFLNQQFKPSAR
ncbi:Acetyl esterase/lipase [Pasteurella testudinis DSM 23072]|uniref:Acetyl esterase/lipase n=1 Tax=Pasteurella testudinis DSM 23072 TaxID=1122938 RepID=A0A1W1UEB9_9PAST|nr:alpha/beta hydrolase [Pasteurella testudinis]SMB79455.1 Acetyl esterase/lipase [Pasteurella testudinis DSM 23072]SUB50764.1 Lipase 2 [Pasteurella testudinis]